MTTKSTIREAMEEESLSNKPSQLAFMISKNEYRDQPWQLLMWMNPDDKVLIEQFDTKQEAMEFIGAQESDKWNAGKYVVRWHQLDEDGQELYVEKVQENESDYHFAG